MNLPQASIRTRVHVPVELAGGAVTEGHVHSFDGLVDGREHLAIRLGRLSRGEVPLVRLHSECLTGDVLGSQRCDCGPQLREALNRIAREGGFLLYLRQEGRGIGLYAKLDAYSLQDRGLDTYAANRALGYPEDGRDYAAAAQMLSALGVSRIRLLSNNPDKAEQLVALGIEVIEQVPTELHLTASNRDYLVAKVLHESHSLDVAALDSAATPRRR